MQLARIVGLGLVVATLGARAAQQEMQTISLRPIAAPASIPIDCSQSPFGASAPVIGDLEPMLQLQGPNGSAFDEYAPSTGNQTPPLHGVYRAQLIQAPLPALSLRKSVSVDLNGDGRDEVVGAFSDGTDVRLAVYSRAAGPTAQIIDTWTFSEGIVPDSIDMVAGNLNGSKDKKQEIAVSWIISATGAVHVIILEGDASGHIGPADNFANGKFLGQAGVAFPRLAVGDFLLSGHDQLVLAGYKQSSGSIELDLIEFGYPFNFVLPNVGQSSTRSGHFQDGLNVGFNTPFFAVDDDPAIPMQGSSPGGGVILALDADGGDVVDTAAAELVLHVMFPELSSPVNHILAQRVLHFVTTRDGNNVITAIALGDSSLPYAHDSSIMLERYDGHPVYTTVPPRFAATVADVDGVGQREIVTARAGHDGKLGGSSIAGSMVWWAHKVHVRLVPSFQYKNQGTIASQPVVKFINNSRGDIKSYSWNFGDATFGPDKNPQHAFPVNGPYLVKLTVTAFDDTQEIYQSVVTVNGSSDANPQGIAPPAWTYKIDPDPVFTGDGEPEFTYYTLAGGDKTVLKLAVGDMDRDGLPEVFVSVTEVNGNARDMHVFQRLDETHFARTSQSEALSGNVNMELVLSDFDGDAISGDLNDAVGDCRAVSDLTVRSLTWMPPYFSTLQADSYRYAEYGLSKSTTTGLETATESHFSESISGYVGFEAKPKIPIIDVKLGGASIKGTFGGAWQQTSGESHGDENGFSLDEGYSIGTDSNTAQAEGMLYTETNTSNCYTYSIVTSAGPVAGSGLRVCSVEKPMQIKKLAGALTWNNLTTELGDGGVQVPIHWVPAQRDWASLALFHAPKPGAATGSPVFPDSVSHGVTQATDGSFDTAAESLTADKPYLEIDLGYVRDILSVRVFPSAAPLSSPTAVEPLDFKAAVKDLWGFRLYASPSPFSGNNPPTASNATTFVPGGISTFVQEKAVYQVWNAWTGDPHSGAPMRARYLRLQKPTSGKIRISEIQVFGDTHTEPQFYPDAVCDKRVGDGRFYAKVFDTVHRVYTTIQVRGDMVWTGGVDTGSTDTGVTNRADDPVVNDRGQPCVNDISDGASDPASPKTVPQRPFWQGLAIGGLGTPKWNLQEDSSHTDSQIHSNDASVRAGVEIDIEGPGDAHVVAGAAFEFEYGVNTEHQNVTTMGTGFGVGGELAGFGLGYQQLADTCEYFPRPYAFEVHEYSNSGYLQDMYVTDYIVRQTPHPSPDWQREAIPSACSDWDRIFAHDFEPGA